MKADLFPYLLESGACLALLGVLYRLLLRKETFFGFNRTFILLSVGLSITLPFIKLPVADLPLPGVPVLFSPTVVVASPVQAPGWNWPEIAFWVYCGVVVCFVLNLFFQIARLARLAHRFPSEPAHTHRLIYTEGQLPTFSFFRWLFWNDQQSLAQESQAQILRHELAHIRQWHSADMLFLELAKALFWFHPAIYLLKKDLREVHEYLADRDAVRESSVESYVQLMATQMLQQFNFSFIQPFSQFQFSKRMKMLQLSQRARPAIWKIAASLLIVTLVAIGYACRPTESVEPSTADNTQALVSALNQYLDRYPNLSTKLDIYQKTGPQLPQQSTYRINPIDEVKAQVNGVNSTADQRKIESLIEKIFSTNQRVSILNNENSLATRLHIATVNVYTKGDAVSLKVSDNPTEAVHIPNTFNSGQVYTVVEEMPEFPGGMEAMMKYLGENVHYPQEAIANKMQGTVFVEFIINSDGAISDAKSVKGMDGLNDEALRVVQSMPQWKPGRQDGKAVLVKYVLPIKFAL